MTNIRREFIFYLPGVPAPIGGFKVVYEHARILKNAGAKVKVIHVNPAICKKNSNFQLCFKKIYFNYRKLFDRWRYYPHQYGLDRNYTNKLKDIPSAATHVVTSWQLMNYVTENVIIDKHKVIHLAMDYPTFMGPPAEVKKSWRIGEKYLAISTHLLNSIVEERLGSNLPETIKYIPPITKKLEYLSNTKKRKMRIFCVVSAGKYKNQEKLIQLLNLLCHHIEIVTFSRELRPVNLSKNIKHLTNLSDNDIQEYYSTSEFSLSYSKFEGFCLPGFEAMFNGAVLFTTDSLGNQDYLKPGQNCIVLSGNRVSDDCKTIRKFLSQSVSKIRKYRECGYKSTQVYLEKFNADYILSAYAEMTS